MPDLTPQERAVRVAVRNALTRLARQMRDAGITVDHLIEKHRDVDYPAPEPEWVEAALKGVGVHRVRYRDGKLEVQFKLANTADTWIDESFAWTQDWEQMATAIAQARAAAEGKG